MKTQLQTHKPTERPPKPFGYSVVGRTVSRIVEIKTEYSILTRHVFTTAQLAEMEV